MFRPFGPQARTRGEEFGVATIACDWETYVVSTHGDIDCVTAPELERELFGAVQLGARRVVVALTETTFFGSTAIRALVRSAERVRAVGGQLSVVCDNPKIKKVFAIAGTDRTLPIHSAIEQALSLKPSGDSPWEPTPGGIDPAARGLTSRKDALSTRNQERTAA